MKTLIYIFTILFLFSTKSFAQDGILDNTFGTNGIVKTVSLQEAFEMVIQPDDKIIVVGSVNNTTTDMAIARYNANGSLDNTFGTNGIVTIDFNNGNDDASAVVLQQDGKIVVVGRAQQSSANSNYDIAAIRLLPNGTLDNTFATNGKFQLDVDGYAYDYALDVALQNDGKIVIVAMAGTNMFNKNAVIRLNTNGTLDNSFDGDGILKAFSYPGGIMSSIHSVAIQQDGKILIGGSNTNNFAVARLNSNGSTDNTYATNGGITIPEMATESKIYLQDDGKLLCTYSNITSTTVVVVRLNSNGSLDAGFGNNGKVVTQIGTASTYNYGRDLVVQPDGKIIVCGSTNLSSSNSDYLLVRYLPNGTIDNTFGATGNGIVTTSVGTTDDDRGKSVRLQSNGKIVVAGSTCTGSCDFVLLRYNNTNTLSINQLTGNNVSFSVYPNPSNGKFTIVSENNSIFYLTDITGKLIKTITVENGTKVIQETLNPGVYFLINSKTGKNEKIMIL